MAQAAQAAAVRAVAAVLEATDRLAAPVLAQAVSAPAPLGQTSTFDRASAQLCRLLR